MLEAGPRWKILALFGVAGVGKTTVARELYRRMWSGHPGRKVFLSCDPTCTDPVTLEMITLKLLAKLEVEDLDPADMTEGARFAVLRQLLNQPGNLIVVDDLAVGLDQHVLRRLLTGIGSSDSTFVTVSRAKPPGYYANQLFEVRPLTPEAAAELVRNRIGRQAEEEHPHEFGELIAHCEGLPSALLAACEAVAATGNLSAVADRLAGDDRCLPVLRGGPRDVGAELAAAYLRLGEEQRRTLVAVSMLRTRAVGAQSVSAILGEPDFRTVGGRLAELEDARLVVAHRDAVAGAGAGEARFRLLRLVRLALEANADFRADRARFRLTRDQLDSTHRTKLHVLYQRWTAESARDIATSAELMELLKDDAPDVLYASAHADPVQVRACWKVAHIIVGVFPIVACDWPMWQDFFAKARSTAVALHNTRTTLPLQAIDQAVALNLLFSGCVEQAESRLTASLARARGRLNVDEDLVIRARVHLAELELERGRYDEAAAHLTDVVARNDPRPFDADIPWAVMVSAFVQRNVTAKLWHRAELLHAARERLTEHLRDPTRKSRLALYIADVLRELGRLADAESEYQAARKVAEEVGDRFTVARADYGRALLMLDRGQIAEAKRLIRVIEHDYLANGDRLWRLRHRYLALLADLAEQSEAADQPAGRERGVVIAEHADRLLREVAPEKDRRLYPSAVLLRVRALMAVHDYEEARRVLDDAMLRLDRDQYRWIRAQAQVLSGQVDHALGRSTKAREDLKAAVRTFVEFHDPLHESRARRELIATWGVLRVAHPQRIALWRLDRRLRRNGKGGSG